jgi:IMP dehydrogenase/GMP reductase
MSRIRQAAGLTFDDVLLVPRHSTVHPREVSTKSRFTRTISLNVPLISAGRRRRWIGSSAARAG